MSQIFWRQSPGARRDVPCLFLDRDGVVVEEVRYLGDAEKVAILPGVRDTLIAARHLGWAVGLVTNQAGVGRGYYDWTDFANVQTRIIEHLDLGTDVFDFVAACGTHPEARHDHLRVEHLWRKPNDGMLRMAQQALALRLEDSVMVGDQLSDVQAGLTAGLPRVAHVLTGHGTEARPGVEAFAATRPVGQVMLLGGLGDLPDRMGWD